MVVGMSSWTHTPPRCASCGRVVTQFRFPSVWVQAKEMCLRFAAMEKKLGEIDRARAIFVHGSQLCDPRTEPGYWEVRVACATTSFHVPKHMRSRIHAHMRTHRLADV